MKLITAKTAQDINLNGIDVQLEITDERLASAILTDADGNMVKFTMDSYTFKALVLAPPPTVTKYQVVGTVLDIPVFKTFDDRREAQAYIDKIAPRLEYDEVELKIAEIEVTA